MLYCCAASSALGRESAERLRERLIFCSQFVIEDPGYVILPDSALDCCRFANPIHDCRFMDWEDKHHGSSKFNLFLKKKSQRDLRHQRNLKQGVT
jgi:hypothetical protein